MYSLPSLPYLYQDLEPFIDTHTVGLHYQKHERNYLNQLNAILERNHYRGQYSLKELVYHINDFPVSDRSDLLFALGGVLNHILYWKSMSPKAKKPEGKLAEQIEKQFGTFAQFKIQFQQAGMRLKGSGYVFLVLKGDSELSIMSVSNQETPLSFGYIPLFNLDLWEHAYYLNYKNEKALYMENFFEVADFSNAERIYESHSNND